MANHGGNGMNEHVGRQLPEAQVTPLAEIDGVLVLIEKFGIEARPAVMQSSEPVVRLMTSETEVPPVSPAPPPDLLAWADANPFVTQQSEKKAA
jgi:hypothetical protein